MSLPLPWDTLFLAGFAYGGYRTLGRWLKYTDDVAKSATDGAYLEGFREHLAKEAAEGGRAKPNPGAGADASGQGHLWRDFGSMKTKQRLALLAEMQKVLEWTGQDGAYRQLVRHKGKPWSALPHGAKQALLAAADDLDWSFLDNLAQAGAAVSKAASLWQVTEPLPLLSAEPALAEALLEDGAGLQELVRSADMAINALLNGQQEVVIKALAPAQGLKVPEVKRQVDLLREVAQGGLGLGSGGKASRGQQLLELLRGLELVPSDAAQQDAKAAAAAALEAAADEAVAPLRSQHTSALQVASSTARHTALLSALRARIKYAPGKPPLTTAVASAVIAAAADELASALADASAAAATAPAATDGGSATSGSTSGASLAARRSAAQRILETAAVVDSTAAALSAALGEDAGAPEEQQAALGDALAQLSDRAAALQDLAAKVVDAKLNKPAAAAKPTSPPSEGGTGGGGAGDEGADSESAEAAEDRAAAAVGAFEEALQGVQAAVAALPAPVTDGEGGEGVTKEDVKSEIQAEVEEAAAAVEAKTKQQQEVALQTARSRERMSLLLGKAKQLMGPPAAPAAAAGAGAGGPAEGQAAEEAPMQPAERLQVTEEFLKQLGARPLAAALTDLGRLLAGATQAASGPDVTTSDGDSATPAAAAASLAAGLTLQPEGAASLARLGQLLSEVNLADAVMKLDLGPDTIRTVDDLAGYVKLLDERHTAEEAGTPSPSPSQTAAAANCKPLIEQLRAEPLLQLGLSAAQYRQLAALREAASLLSPDLDALKYDRCVTALKDVASQLGAIGAAIQTRIANTTDEALRSMISQQKALAVDLYDRLQAFLTFEQDIRGPLKKCLRELASLAGGIGAPRTAKDCSAAELKLEMAAEEGSKLQALLSQLAGSTGEGSFGADVQPPPDSVAATQQVVTALQGSVEAMQASLDTLAAHVALRARCLNPDTAASAAASGVTAEDLDLVSLETMEPELRGQHLTLLSSADADQLSAWEHSGFEQIARGRVAAVLLATEVADSHTLNPRGEDLQVNVADGTPRVAVPVIGLPSGKCVLQLLAERILKVQQLAAAETFGHNAPVTRLVQWYIMTSPATHAKLETLLAQHSHFGLQASQVHLFRCDTAPPAFAGEPLRALTVGAATLTRGSAGSGEVFGALQRSGALRHMKRAGIRHVEVNAVDDNVLARPADPLLIGFCVVEGYDAAAKVVEPDTLPAVYAAASTSGEGAANAGEEQPDTGLLDETITFLAPGIGSYYFSYAALSRVTQYVTDHPLALYRLVPVPGLPSKAPPPQLTVNLPPNATQAQRMQAHQALVAAQQAAANTPPRQVDGWVPTRFISDVFVCAGAGGGGSSATPLAPLEGCRLAYLGVERMEEFSVMFSTGPHLAVPTLDQAAGELMALTTGWVEEHGGVVECDEGVEVAPLVSYAGEDLDAVVVDQVFAEPYDLVLQGATAAGKPKHNAGPWAVPVMAVYAVGAGLALVKQLARK